MGWLFTACRGRADLGAEPVRQEPAACKAVGNGADDFGTGVPGKIVHEPH